MITSKRKLLSGDDFPQGLNDLARLSSFPITFFKWPRSSLSCHKSNLLDLFLTNCWKIEGEREMEPEEEEGRRHLGGAGGLLVRTPRAWPTIDGPLGPTEEDSEAYARSFFKFGFLLLPWLWAINCYYFWPVIRSNPRSFPRIRRCKSQKPNLSLQKCIWGHVESDDSIWVSHDSAFITSGSFINLSKFHLLTRVWGDRLLERWNCMQILISGVPSFSSDFV